MKVLETYKHKSKKRKKSIGIVGAQYSFGQKLKGVEKASSHIRYNGLSFIVDSLFHKAIDYGDIFQQSRKSKHFEDNEKDLKRLYDLCVTSIKENDFSLFLGGDHSVGMSTVAATKEIHKDAIVIWIDAHTDINTPETSASNNLHGMPVSFLLGLNEKKYRNHYSWAQSKLNANDIIYFGVRDIDTPEQQIIDNLGITTLTMDKIKIHGAKNCLKMALEKLDPKGKRPIHVSFDIDSIDPKYVKATGVRANNGLSLLDLQDTVNELSNRKVIALDFVELNPDLASNEIDLKSEINILFQILLRLHPFLKIQDELLFQH